MTPGGTTVNTGEEVAVSKATEEETAEAASQTETAELENSFFSHVMSGARPGGAVSCRGKKGTGGSGKWLQCRLPEPRDMEHPGPDNRCSPPSSQDLIGERLLAGRRCRF